MKRIFLGCIIGAGLTAIRHADELSFAADMSVSIVGLAAIVISTLLLSLEEGERDQ